MQIQVMPFGSDGWSAREQLVSEIIASRSRPPFLYDDVLIIVSSARLKRRYGRLFLDALQKIHNARCLVQPDIRILHQFFEQQYERLRGPRLLDEQSRLVLLEGLVKDELSRTGLFSLSPDLLAPSLSSALSRTVEQLAMAGIGAEALSRTVGTEPFADKPQVALLLNVYAGYERSLRERNLTDPGGMRHLLRDRFDRSGLGRYRRVILDGIHDAEQVEADILKQVAACIDCLLLVDAPSAALVRDAPESHPLGAVRNLVRALNGSVGDGGSLRTEADTTLAAALFSDDSFEEACRRVRHAPPPAVSLNLLSAVSMREEVCLIAREVKDALRKGIPPDSVLVVFPGLDEYAPLLEELFPDYGIPYNRALGRPLGTSAVTTALISLLRACQEDFTGPALLRVFSSPFLKYGENPETAPAVDRFLRKRNLTGGKQKLLAAAGSASAGENALAARSISDVIAALEPFDTGESAGLSVWMDRLSRLLAWSGLGARAGLIRGPLNVNLQAFRKLEETLRSLAAAGRTFPEYGYTFSEWLFLLRKTFMHARFQVPPEDEGGVQVLGLEESLALPWTRIYLGGMVDGKFPQRLPRNIFLPEQTLEALGIRTPERIRLKASYHFYRLLLSAPRVTLTRPELDGDKPVVPSPFLQELEPLREAGVLNRGAAASSGLQFTLRMEDSRSLAELAKAMAIANPEQNRNLSAAISALPEPRPEAAERIAALIAAGERNYAAARPASPCPAIRDFRVTDLDAYLACPYDYYVTRVLGIEPLEELSDDLSPLDRGSKVHAVLRDFYRTWTEPVTGENRDAALARLRELAAGAFAGDADTFRNRRTRSLFDTVMAERFVDAELLFWAGDMKPAYLEQTVEHSLVLASGAEVRLSGRIDRIDADRAGNFVIVDYKTGKYPLPKKSGDQEIFQLPIYALMAKETLARSAPSVVKPVGLAYYDLAGRASAGARDVVLFDRDVRDDHPCSKPSASPKSAEEFSAILQQSLDKARAAVEGILAGRFPAVAREEARCRTCSSSAICRRDEEATGAAP